MAHHDRGVNHGILAVVDVKIRPTDAGGVDRDEYLAGPGGWPFDLTDRKFVGSDEKRLPHHDDASFL